MAVALTAVASTTILPRASDSFARQEEDEEDEEAEEVEDVADREPFEPDALAGLPEPDRVFGSVFEGFDSPSELDASDEAPDAPFAAAPLLASARLSVR